MNPGAANGWKQSGRRTGFFVAGVLTYTVILYNELVRLRNDNDRACSARFIRSGPQLKADENFRKLQTASANWKSES